jgi:hypothetical protein
MRASADEQTTTSFFMRENITTAPVIQAEEIHSSSFRA